MHCMHIFEGGFMCCGDVRNSFEGSSNVKENASFRTISLLLRLVDLLRVRKLFQKSTCFRVCRLLFLPLLRNQRRKFAVCISLRRETFSGVLFVSC
jgi:hypothetical protein